MKTKLSEADKEKLHATLNKRAVEIDAELNTQIKKALRLKGIEPTNKIIKRVNTLQDGKNPMLVYFVFDYGKTTEIPLLSFEVKMHEKNKLTTEIVIFEEAEKV